MFIICCNQVCIANKAYRTSLRCPVYCLLQVKQEAQSTTEGRHIPRN